MVDLFTQTGFLGRGEEVLGRYFFALGVEQAQQHFVVLVTVAAQADDRLEQQAEAVVFQCLLHHRQHAAAVGGGGQFIGRIEQFQRIAVA